MGEILILMSVAAGLTAIVALFRPLPRLYLPTRTKAVYLLALSFLVFGIGGSMLPDLPYNGEVVIEAEGIDEQPEFIALHEIMMKWRSERDRYNDPAEFVFSSWNNKRIRTVGIVFEKLESNYDEVDRGFHVYFHDGGGDKELVDGVWKWTGFNRGVYANMNEKIDIETVEIDEFLRIVCKGIQPKFDLEGGILFGIELQNCQPEIQSE